MNLLLVTLLLLPAQSPTARGLIDAGRVYPGARVCQSEAHPTLMAAATAHARYQAQQCRQGHQHFAERSAMLARALGPHQFAEICAESWPWQADDSPLELGHEMFKCWRQSSGHWSVASRRHRYFGADMARGRDGIWYACIIVAD